MKSVKKILLSLLLGCFFCASFWSEEYTDTEEHIETYTSGYNVDLYYTSTYMYLCERPERLGEDFESYMVLAYNPKECTNYIIMFETREDANSFCKGYWGICRPFYSAKYEREGVPEKILKPKNDEIADFMQPYTGDILCEFFVNLGRIRIVRVQHSEKVD